MNLNLSFIIAYDILRPVVGGTEQSLQLRIMWCPIQCPASIEFLKLLLLC